MKNKEVLILLAEGFEEIEALTVADVLRRMNIGCSLCSIETIEVTGAHGIRVLADTVFESIVPETYDVVVLPGGMPGAGNLKSDKRVLSLLKKYNQAGKLIAAICAAPIVLQEAGITDGLAMTSFPGFSDEFKTSRYRTDSVVQDGNIITSRGPGTALEFAFTIAENLTEAAIVQKVRHSMLAD